MTCLFTSVYCFGTETGIDLFSSFYSPIVKALKEKRKEVHTGTSEGVTVGL